MTVERSVTKVVEGEPLAATVNDEFSAALVELSVIARSDPAGPVARHLRSITAGLPVIVFGIDRAGVFRWCYGGGLRPLRLEDDELVGRGVDVFGPVAVEAFARLSAGTLAGTRFELEGDLDGEPWALLIVATSLPGEGGIAAVAVDTTAAATARQARGRIEDLFAAAVEAIDEGVLVQGKAGRLVLSNSSVGRILGVDADELASLADPENGWRVVNADGSPLALDDLPGARTSVTGEAQKGVVIGTVSPGGTTTWLSVNSFPVTLDGELLVVSTFTDVTEQRALHENLLENEQRFRLLSASAPIGIFISDNDNEIAYANPELERQTGLAAADIQARGWTEIIHPDDVKTVSEHLRRFIVDDVPYRTEHRIARPDGTVTWIRARLARMTNARGESLGLVGTAADITDYVEANERLRESEERTRAIVETAAEGIITTDESRLVIEFNAAAERMLGFDSDEVVGRLRFDDLVVPDQLPALLELLDAHLPGGSSGFVGRPVAELAFGAKDGAVVPVELAVTETVTSEGRLFTGMLHDISERKAFEKQLEHQATHDALTGLPNRALLAAELETTLARGARNRRGVGVLFVELGRMSLVTDSLGHQAGDQLLIEAARRLEAVVGAVGQVARFGGHRFVLVAEDLDDVGDAVDLATIVLAELDRPFVIAGEEALVKAAVGIAFATQGQGSAESLISNADVAMNRARRHAGTGFEVFDSEMRRWVDDRRKLEVAMRHGIDRGEFELYYQPVITLDGLAIHGFEALVRWNHPDLGLLPPDQFIALAEDSGLILPLGERLLRDACGQLASWQRAYPDRPPTVSVNLSGRQLERPDLSATVAAALLESGADPQGLDLEITETVLLDDVEAAATTLDGLKKIGVNLAVDDFGTGYSSLTYLCRFPIDVVKVDRSFVSQIGTQSRDASIVSVVVGLAQTLRMDVVAEGVETVEQLGALADLDCSYAQGYLFSRPCRVAEADRLLAAGTIDPAGGA